MAFRARLLGRLGQLLSVKASSSLSFLRMKSICFISISGLWCDALNFMRKSGSFCFLVEIKSSTLLNTLLFVVVSISFNFGKMFGVRNRWQYTRARCLFSIDFKVCNKCGTAIGRKLLLWCLEMLLFNKSCQMKMSFLSERSSENKFCTIFFGFFWERIETQAWNRENLFVIVFFRFSGVKVSRA